MLRGSPGLSERGGQFERKGCRVVEVRAAETAIDARSGAGPAMSRSGESRTLKNGADVRRFTDDVKQRLARWKDADD